MHLDTKVIYFMDTVWLLELAWKTFCFYLQIQLGSLAHVPREHMDLSPGGGGGGGGGGGTPLKMCIHRSNTASQIGP